MQDYGYIALHRRVFNHPLFINEKPVTRFHAWTWLIAAAAWCPCQRRVGRGPIATLDRGQLATTFRELGKTWGWPLARTRRFIAALKRDGMIRTLAAGTAPGTAPGTASQPSYTVITICNYSQFQNKSTGEDSQQAQPQARKPRRGEQQQLDLAGEILPQESNHTIKKAREVVNSGEKRTSEKRGRTKPRHGQVSKKHGTIWCDYGTDDYRLYADDFKEVTGTWPVPQQYVDGKGRWFKRLGEGAVPLGRAGGAAHAAIEQAARQRRRTA